LPPERPAGGAQAAAAAAGAAAPLAVIDTNIWLDLYVFADAAAQGLARSLAKGQLQAIRSDPTDAELRVVLARPAFAARSAALGPEPLLAWQALAARQVAQRPAPWVCRDPDDQKFLDLAYSAGASLLFTKDRALLSLARRARGAGLAIVQPKDYA